MKKIFTLIVCATMAIAASAQTLAQPAQEGRSLVLAKQLKASNVVNAAEKVQAQDFTALRAKFKAAQADLYGQYIMTNYENIYSTSTAEMKKLEEDGVEYVNLVWGDGDYDIVGTFANDTITFPAQYVETWSGSETYGKLVLYGLVQKEDGMYYSNDIHFVVDPETGVLNLVEEGWNFNIPDYSDGKYYWERGYASSLMKPNGVMAAAVNGKSFGSGWVQKEWPIYIEDNTENIVVYNFLGMAAIGMDINEDLSVSIEMKQPIRELGSDDPDTYGKYLCLNGVDTEGNSIRSNNEKETSAARLSDFNSIITEEYMHVCSEWDSEGSGYALCWIADEATFTLNAGAFKITDDGTDPEPDPDPDETGIESVKTSDNQVKSQRTYNVMGQQVNPGAKGLIIRDGKKMFVK